VDPGSGIFLTLDPGSGLEKIRIRDKHPGSATLAVGTAGRKESFPVMCANQFSNESWRLFLQRGFCKLELGTFYYYLLENLNNQHATKTLQKISFNNRKGISIYSQR
jgi:hypothetical protein